MSFAKVEEILEMPNFLDIQKKSYKWLLDKGITEVLNEVSPIVDYAGNLVIEFVDYNLSDTPKCSVEESKERDVNYAAPLRVTVRLTNKSTGEVKQQDIFMGDFPLMTETGTFVINGAERVVVSQLVRSPGMYYEIQTDKVGKNSYAGTVIPYRGAWLEYETDMNDVFYVKIDKNRKIPVTTLIRALDEATSTSTDIKTYFGEDNKIVNTLEKDGMQAEAEKNGTTPYEEALKEIYKKMRPGEPPLVESAQLLLNNLFFDPKRYDLGNVGRYKFDKKVALGKRITNKKLTRPVINPITGEILFDAGKILTYDEAMIIENAGVNEAYVQIEDEKEIKVFGNGMVDPAKVLGCDLREVGINEKVKLSLLLQMLEEVGGDFDELKKQARDRAAELSPKHITKDDIFASINYLICLSHNIGTPDDIDHLGNRRIRAVGELIQNQLRIGFSRMDKIIKERMTIQDAESLTPQALINIRPVVAAIREFFGSSPLSQFMDQNNPLAELTHKRRLSALGPGGLSRDRASFDVRDVHYTHFGRICPIETPEGPNIGLISYLATYAKINDYGFIEAPYRKIDKATGKITDIVEYMTADVEDNFIIAQANEPVDEEGRFINKRVTVRDRAEIIEVDASVPDYIDVSPKMAISVATGHIPFLENDDNARALMGSNMQKQAVPLLTTDSPIVGTGMEYKAGIDSGVCVLAKSEGVVEYVSSEKIVVVRPNGVKDAYTLLKFKRSNQGNCVNQRPIVNVGDVVKEGDVLADGAATDKGEIALGKNALIGFMTWEGYNYEDAVLLNERLVRNDVYTSIHIEEYLMESRDTKLGPEEITREIPNCGDDALKDLDADGIVRIGTEVHAGDILVGKVTPKGETELTAEERLLRAIFGEKAREVRDTSLKLPHGTSGVVSDIRVFSRENGDDLAPGVNKAVKVYVAQKRKISVGDKMAGRHGNKGVVSRILPPEDMPYLADGTPLDIVLNPLGVPSRMNIGQVLEVHLGIAARELGVKVMTPAFDGAKEKDITEALTEAGLYREILPGENFFGKSVYEETVDEEGNKVYNLVPADQLADKEWLKEKIAEKKLKTVDGKRILYDGRTGEPFDNPVTVGIMYYLKLHHLVDDKIHARSTGPYSLVTQQPLGGKAQFGGQRFGEMEVWALEAYGAAYTLQEILTVKSDDVTGRVKAYEAIVKGKNIPTPGVPEAFRVLVKELQSLALDVRVLDEEGNEIELSQLCEEEEEMNENRITADDVGKTVETDGDSRDITILDDLRDQASLDDDDSDEDEDDEEYDDFDDEEIYEDYDDTENYDE
ncbi:MAG: DNA-directed RNA polymerase subunit beta [Ruminococcaceae bacterium]|nr:DNA-directed RNA polymerase subunit beta [Oscillospiraceae bacterium]